MRIDSLARIYYVSDTLLESYSNGRYQVSSSTAAYVTGAMLSDTSFQDTLLPGSRIFNGYRHPGGRFTLGTVLNASGDTLFALSASPLEDTVKVEFSGRSAAFVRQGEGLALTDASGTRAAAATAAYGVLTLSFSSADALFSGEIVLNTLTGKGSGTLVNRQGGVTYSISVNVAGQSKIEDIGL